MAVTPASNKVCGLSGNVGHIQGCCPAHDPVGNKYISWAGLAVAGGKVVANLYLHSNVGTTTHFHNAVTKSVVPGDHISSTFTCDCMMAEMVKYISWAQGTLGTP